MTHNEIDAFEVSYSYYYQRAVHRLTPREKAAREHDWLKRTAWNPSPKYGLRVAKDMGRQGLGPG